MNNAYVCLGSNSSDAAVQLSRAVDALSQLPGVHLDAVSPVYRTEPQEYREQPWFLNQVARLLCCGTWTGRSLLEALLKIECAMGRQRSPDPALRYGPRCLDLDLLLFGVERSDVPQCILPHPRMLQRAFVLVPLRDIAPEVILANGKTPGQTLDALHYSAQGGIICQTV